MCVHVHVSAFFFFFFNDTATTEIYTLSLHDALPISRARAAPGPSGGPGDPSNAYPRVVGAGTDSGRSGRRTSRPRRSRSEEHTSELQSQSNLVCRLLLEKKNKSEHTDMYLQSSRGSD